MCLSFPRYLFHHISLIYQSVYPCLSLTISLILLLLKIGPRTVLCLCLCLCLSLTTSLLLLILLFFNSRLFFYGSSLLSLPFIVQSPSKNFLSSCLSHHFSFICFSSSSSSLFFFSLSLSSLLIFLAVIFDRSKYIFLSKFLSNLASLCLSLLLSHSLLF